MRDQEQSTVEAIANKIEEKLHNLHQEINPKYKNKYRSLVFNLKDVKNQVCPVFLLSNYDLRTLNSSPPPPLSLSLLLFLLIQGLFRKVVLGEITPYELVRMSTEKLASKDLAQWREQTIKKVSSCVCPVGGVQWVVSSGWCPVGGGMQLKLLNYYLNCCC